MRNWLAKFAVSATLMLPLPVFAASHEARFFHMNMPFGFGFMFLGPIMMIVFIGLVVALIILLVRWLGGGHPVQSLERGSRALIILEERFAAGEIDRDEFLRRKAELR